MTTPRLPRCQTPGCSKAAKDGDRCKPHALVEDATWLLDAGESPEDVCRRLDTTIAALCKAFARTGTLGPHRRTIEAADTRRRSGRRTGVAA